MAIFPVKRFWGLGPIDSKLYTMTDHIVYHGITVRFVGP